MKKPTAPAAPAIALPPGITEADCKYRAYNPKKPDPTVAYLTFHYTQRFGWCLATLHISNPRRGSTSSTARTYGITVKDKQVVTVGAGPHVLRTVEVMVRESRKAALQQYLSLKTEGEAMAGDIRDRISTRRAQTVARRSPRWDM